MRQVYCIWCRRHGTSFFCIHGNLTGKYNARRWEANTHKASLYLVDLLLLLNANKNSCNLYLITCIRWPWAFFKGHSIPHGFLNRPTVVGLIVFTVRGIVLATVDWTAVSVINITRPVLFCDKRRSIEVSDGRDRLIAWQTCAVWLLIQTPGKMTDTFRIDTFSHRHRCKTGVWIFHQYLPPKSTCLW